jgi:hypothetical protein
VVFFVTVSVIASSVDDASIIDDASVSSHVAVAQALIKQGGGGVENSTNVPVAFPVNVMVVVTRTVELGGGPLRIVQLLRDVGVDWKLAETEGDGEGLLDLAVLDTFRVELEDEEVGVELIEEELEKETGEGLLDRTVLDFFVTRLDLDSFGMRLECDGEEVGVEVIEEELVIETGEGLLDWVVLDSFGLDLDSFGMLECDGEEAGVELIEE